MHAAKTVDASSASKLKGELLQIAQTYSDCGYKELGRKVNTILVLQIAQIYSDCGYGTFVTKLANTAPHLFTFLPHPHLEPTNNSAERMLRPVVISRKIRQGTRNKKGQKRLGMLLTCFLTWRRRRGCLVA